MINNKYIEWILTSVLNWYAFFFAKRVFAFFNEGLIQLGLRGLGVGNFTPVGKLKFNCDIGGEEKIIRYLIKAKYALDVVFDVGASVGNYSQMLVSAGVSEDAIYAFEPNPQRKNKWANTKFKFYPFGFFEKKEKRYIYDMVNPENTSEFVLSTLYNESSDRYKQVSKKILIELNTIDNFVKEQSINKINFLKMDIEGSEFAALKGAKKALSENIIDIIQFEFNYLNIHSRVFFKDFFNLLENYKFYRLLPNGLLALDYETSRSPLLMELFTYQNIIAFRKDIDRGAVSF